MTHTYVDHFYKRKQCWNFHPFFCDKTELDFYLFISLKFWLSSVLLPKNWLNFHPGRRLKTKTSDIILSSVTFVIDVTFYWCLWVLWYPVQGWKLKYKSNWDLFLFQTKLSKIHARWTRLVYIFFISNSLSNISLNLLCRVENIYKSALYLGWNVSCYISITRIVKHEK